MVLSEDWKRDKGRDVWVRPRRLSLKTSSGRWLGDRVPASRNAEPLVSQAAAISMRGLWPAPALVNSAMPCAHLSWWSR